MLDVTPAVFPEVLTTIPLWTVGPEIVIACNDCDNVMLFPPTRVADPEAMMEVAPAVFPLVLITRAL